MTTYYELATDDTGQMISWDNPAAWNRNSVPDGTGDGVILQALSGPAGLYINTGVSHSIASLQMQANLLLIAGSLTAASNISIGGTASIDLANGALSANHIVINGDGLTGVGGVSASEALEVFSTVTASSAVGGAGVNPGTLTLSGATFYNSGTLEAGNEGTLLVETTQANGFLNFSNGTLTGGIWQLDSGGTLELKTSGVITTDAATIVIDGNYPSMMSSYNPDNGTFENIETTLDLVASSGTLTVNNANFALEFGLTVDGKVALNDGTLGAHTLTIAQGGVISYAGSTSNPGIQVDADFLVDNGQIVADATASADTDLVLQLQPRGSGSIVVGPAVNGNTVTVDLEQAASVSSIVFSDDTGTVTLGTPAQVTSSFHGFAEGDSIILKGIGLSSVTGTSYSGSGTAGTLTIDEGGTAINLAFAGDYATQNFSLSAGTGSSPSLVIHEVAAPAPVALIGVHH